MKKIFQYVAILVAGLSLMACDLLPGQSKGGGTPAEQKEAKSGALSASNKEIEMKVKGGQYILPSDGKENSKYLALNWKLRINQTKQLEFPLLILISIILMVKKLS